jgi:O-antigen/teichoic acid export membrane protein
VQSETNDRGSLPGLRDFLYRHMVLILILVSLCGLVVFPIADCFDCEGPHSWGRDDAAFAVRTTLFLYWLVGASLLAGFSRRRFDWTVPIAITVICCATEPLGGVPLWSLLRNEGPVGLIFSGSIGLASFLLGMAARFVVEILRRRVLRSRTQPNL